MKHMPVIALALIIVIGCGNNRTNDTNIQSRSDSSSSTLDISRKSGNNTGVQDSSGNKIDSPK